MEDPEIGLLEQKIKDLENELSLSGDQFQKKVMQKVQEQINKSNS